MGEKVLTILCLIMESNKFVCDDCGEEFHISDEADKGVCDWCWMVAGA